MLLDVSPSMTESEMLYVVAASRSAGFLVCSFKPSKLQVQHSTHSAPSSFNIRQNVVFL